MCTVEVRLLTGHRTDMRLVDLAERMAEHYRDAGHVASAIAALSPDGRAWFGTLLHQNPQIVDQLAKPNA